jgi:hypothetical protein
MEAPQAEAEGDPDGHGDHAGAELRHDQRGHRLARGRADRPEHRLVASGIPGGEGRHDPGVDGGQHQQQTGRAEDDRPDLVVEDRDGGVAGGVPRLGWPEVQQVKAVAQGQGDDDHRHPEGQPGRVGEQPARPPPRRP